MSDVNKVLLTGNVGGDPELKINTDKTVAIFKLASNYKAKNGDTSAEWSRCVAFGKNAETIGQYVKKGARLFVDGRKHTSSYTDEKGNIKYTTDIIVNNFIFLSTKDKDPEQAPTF